MKNKRNIIIMIQNFIMAFLLDTNSHADSATYEGSFNGYTDDEIHKFIREIKIDQTCIDSLITLCNYVSRYVRSGRELAMKSSSTRCEETFRDTICNLIKRKNPNDITLLSSTCMDYYNELSKMHEISSVKNALLNIRSETFQDCILDIKKRIREIGVNSRTVPDHTLCEFAKECCDELARRIIMNVIDESLEEESLKILEKS